MNEKIREEYKKSIEKSIKKEMIMNYIIKRYKSAKKSKLIKVHDYSERKLVRSNY